MSVEFNGKELVSRIACCVQETLDLSDIADEISIRDISEEIADRIDVREVAEYVELDVDDVAASVDLDEVANYLVSKRDFWTTVFEKMQSDREVFNVWVDEWVNSEQFSAVRIKLRDEMTVWFYEHIAPDLPKNWRKKLKKRIKRKSKKGSV